MRKNSFFTLALPALASCLALLAQQTAMAPATTERPLADRVHTFERAERDSWQKPDEVVKAIGLKPGIVVADIGAGSGYFTRRFAKAVQPNGKVYAVDIDKEVLNYLKEHTDKDLLNNIVIVNSTPDDPVLPENSIDVAFFCDTSHHIVHRVALYEKVGRALKPGGRMVNIDLSPDFPEHPHKYEELIPRWQAVCEGEQAGFRLASEPKILLPRAYFLVFRKK